MKVLFAVSDEETSQNIVKRYQQKYKEIISYKNVYFFNSLLKELQKDKTYDRVIISEDLEKYTNKQYDQIDKFIFDILDSVSDEASNIKGNDIPIILICSDRRTKSEQMLVKLFGIGIYNALLGTDRSIDMLCELIHQPRLKKEAKIYYEVDTEEVKYKSESENDVSEIEIQNILAHYKRLGKNEEKYIESFDNIASQYNEHQLRVICKFLPLNVRAVLEEKSPKYQKIISFNAKVSDKIRKPKNEKEISGTSEKLLKTSKSAEKILSKPVVIPNAVNMQKNQKMSKMKGRVNPDSSANVSEKKGNTYAKNANEVIQNKNNRYQEEIIQQTNQPVQENIRKEQQINEPQRRLQEQQQIVNHQQRNQIRQQAIQQQKSQMQQAKDINQQMEQVIPTESVQINQPIEEKPVKRGRGRPRKNPPVNIEESIQEPVKKKRGRPRKNPPVNEQEQIKEEAQFLEANDFEELSIQKVNEVQEENTSVMSDFNINNQDETFPGFKDVDMQEDDDMFSDFENVKEQEGNILPGFEEYEQEKNMLPGFEEDEQEENMLPGFGENEQEENILTSFEEDEQEDMFSGFETYEQEENTSLGFENESNTSFDFSNREENVTQNFKNSENDIQGNERMSNFQGINQQQESNKKNNFEVDVTIDISDLLAQNRKIACFVGTSKNGTSFVVNNLAEILSKAGISTAILDMTQNKNAYYIYTKSEEELRNIAMESFENLVNGEAKGIQVNKNLAVYTSLPGDEDYINKAGEMLHTLAQNYTVVLIDCDFQTPLSYFAYAQEIYLIQSLDVLTIQPLTAFLNELKARNILDENKLRVVLNKVEKLKGVTDKIIIGGMSSYNDPAMSYMVELFDKNLIKYIAIPFDEQVYVKYLEGLISCELSLKGYSKNMMQVLTELGNMIYPTSGKSTYRPPTSKKNGFAPNINSTLEQMRKY